MTSSGWETALYGRAWADALRMVETGLSGRLLSGLEASEGVFGLSSIDPGLVASLRSGAEMDTAEGVKMAPSVGISKDAPAASVWAGGGSEVGFFKGRGRGKTVNWEALSASTSGPSLAMSLSTCWTVLSWWLVSGKAVSAGLAMLELLPRFKVAVGWMSSSDDDIFPIPSLARKAAVAA